MSSLHRFSLAVLIFQIYVNAAPRDIAKLEEIAKVKQADGEITHKTPIIEELAEIEKSVDKPYTLDEEAKNDSNSTEQGQRQKRFYNYYGYGFPPISPVIYPNVVKRDESPYTGSYGYEDPFLQIYRRLQDIADVVKQPNTPPPPPPISQFPIFFPVIYIPQIGCGCTPNQNIPPNPIEPSTLNGTDDVGISNRFPDMDDERQNWGLFVNETIVQGDPDEDFSRPISFEPMQPNRTMSRPPPPVNHGTNQGEVTSQNPTLTTTTSLPELRPPSSVAVEIPSACDGAILSCCHQPQVTYDCFAVQGCPDPSSYGNPCDSHVILRVIDRFQRFYGQR